MAWHGDQIDRIAGSEELQITATRPDGTQRRWTPIWVVRVGDGLFVRPAAADLAHYDGAAELERGLDILLSGLSAAT